MSSLFANAQALINGGTFTQVNGDAHYHGFRGPDVSDILHRATATAAFHNSDERFDPPKCHPNTRLAVLTKIMRWIQWGEDLDAFIMWVYGPAGAGKSAIAQTIAEMCEEEMILLASFFFSRNDPSRSTVKPLIATIAYQITSNLHDAREAILVAIERDPLIFSKSLATQVESLIMGPLQLLADRGYFNNSISRRLIIIDGLDECFNPKIQQHIAEVLANSQQRHGLPLKFLIASRPEQRISFAFSTGALPSVTTRIALDESYLPDKDIELFLTDKFHEIKSTHPRRAYIPPQWPLPEILNQLVKKSSGQFVYASTVIRYVTSIRHKPTDRLDIILGIRPPQKDLPFSELDALYAQILGRVEDIECVLEILGIALFWNYLPPTSIMEKFLSLEPGDVELYLADLNSLVTLNHEPDPYVRVLHASFTDFLMDPTRSQTFWINPQARHAAFACRCLQISQLKGNIEMLGIGLRCLLYHLENAEMTSKLLDELINFSFDSLQDAVKERKKFNDGWVGSAHNLPARFFKFLERLSFPEANHIYQTFQANFERTLCNALEQYHSHPGFALLLGSVLQYTKFNHPSFKFPPGLVASLYFLRQEGNGDILDDMGFSGVISNLYGLDGTPEFFTYFIELLRNPERSVTYAFDQHRYATAAKECLQLCLCSHHKFSKGATELVLRNKVLLRNKPWAWKTRVGIHSRIRTAMHHVTIRQWKSLKVKTRYISQYTATYPKSASELTEHEYEYYRFLAYQWRLDLLPIFLEKSAILLELADVLRTRTFTTMARRFPRRMRLAREAIAAYLLRVEEYAVGGP